MSIKVGCCGFARAHAAYYAAFPCIEIASSFYQLPRIETALRWREAAPVEFEFCMKAWQVITHHGSSPTYKRTRIDASDREQSGHFGFNATVRWAWKETLAIADALAAVTIVFQCASSFRPNASNLDRMREFFVKAKRGKHRLAWEPRGPEWTPELVATLCRELDVVAVGNPLEASPGREKLRYYRLHGTHGTHSRFTDDELRRVREACEGPGRVYVMFNNVAMAEDAARFQRLCGAKPGS
jgi:uncharacterized protein YecE (DUF72 family)